MACFSLTRLFFGVCFFVFCFLFFLACVFTVVLLLLHFCLWLPCTFIKLIFLFFFCPWEKTPWWTRRKKWPASIVLGELRQNYWKLTGQTQPRQFEPMLPDNSNETWSVWNCKTLLEFLHIYIRHFTPVQFHTPDGGRISLFAGDEFSLIIFCSYKTIAHNPQGLPISTIILLQLMLIVHSWKR